MESPLRLGESDEPEPDPALVRQRIDGYLEAHPGASDTVLVIEVADNSLRFDLETKARLHAEAGIAWYRVVDGSQPRLIEVTRGPADAPLLETLRREVETLLASIPAAASA